MESCCISSLRPMNCIIKLFRRIFTADVMQKHIFPVVNRVRTYKLNLKWTHNTEQQQKQRTATCRRLHTSSHTSEQLQAVWFVRMWLFTFSRKDEEHTEKHTQDQKSQTLVGIKPQDSNYLNVKGFKFKPSCSFFIIISHAFLCFNVGVVWADSMQSYIANC